jgi:RNA polymerase sigma factor (sigma-70 family)
MLGGNGGNAGEAQNATRREWEKKLEKAIKTATAIAERYLDYDLAQDIGQMIGIDLWQRYDTESFWPAGDNITPYLGGCVRNKIRTERRDRGRKRKILEQNRYEFPLTMETLGYGGVSGDLEFQRLQKFSQETVDKLPARCRQAFVALKVEEKSYQTVAAEMGITVGAVNQLLVRANTALRKALAEFKRMNKEES